MPGEAVFSLLFMATSATAALALAAFNRWFIRLPEPPQMLTAIIVWMLHILVLLLVTART